MIYSKMRGLAITNKGIEDISVIEIKEILGIESKTEDMCAVFDIKKIEQLCELSYSARSLSKVVLLLDHFKFKKNPFDELKKRLGEHDLQKWVDSDGTYCVRCIRKGEHEFNSADVEAKLGGFVQDKFNLKVNLRHPDLVIFVFICQDNCYLGIDFSGEDLSKRDYRIFLGSSYLKGNISYALVRIAGFAEPQILLDPFVSSGVIPIEAALYLNNMSVNYYNKEKFAFLKLKCFEGFDFDNFFEKIDSTRKKSVKGKVNAYADSFKNLKSAEKNAKIAGAKKMIKFSRQEATWLDVKFDKHSVDKIVTLPPQIGKFSNVKAREKRYKELFYQAEFILREDGRVVLITKKDELLKKYAAEYKFKVKEERYVWQGKQQLKVIVFRKS